MVLFLWEWVNVDDFDSREGTRCWTYLSFSLPLRLVMGKDLVVRIGLICLLVDMIGLEVVPANGPVWVLVEDIESIRDSG